MHLEVNGEAIHCYHKTRQVRSDRGNVIFIHGAAMDHTVWTSTADALASCGHNVFAVDLPRHGKSRGRLLTSIEDMSDWLLDFMDATDITETSLIGHSMGSLVALAAAARNPGQFKKVAMVATAVPMPVSEPILNSAERGDPSVYALLTQWSYSRRYLYGANPCAGLWMKTHTLDVFERSAPGVLFNDMSACNSYTSGFDHARQVDCPVLLIVGEDDRLTPIAGTDRLQELLSNAEVVRLPACGHTIMVEAPEALHDALSSAL